MRLLMTADAVGGVWSYALGLAGGLRRHGVSTTLAVLGPPPSPSQRRDAEARDGLDVVETGAALDWLAEDEASVQASAESVARLARRTGADVVHLNTPALAALARFAVPVVGTCHSCLATWWGATRAGEPPPDFRWRIAMLGRGYAACDALIAPTAAFATATARAHGPRPIVVHNGLDADHGLRPPMRDEPPFVLTAGRLWDEGKNLAALDAAAGMLDARVVAAGPLSGPGGATGVPRHAIPLGALPTAALRNLMRRARVFASVARYEPFGLAVLEAAREGCALVLSDIATFRELWDGAALFVPADDPAAIAATLRRVLGDAGLAATLATAARARARRYPATAMAAGTHAVHRAVSAARVGGAAA